MADGEIKKPDIPITILDGGLDEDAEANMAHRNFGGLPYGLDYGLSFHTPSRVSINFISEDGLYDTEDLDKLVFEEGVRGIPHAIQFLGGKEFESKLFYGFPLKYTVKNSPSGNLLTVEYFDTSIIWLDNRFVLLAGEDIPFSASSQEELLKDPKNKGKVPDNIIANPCPPHFLIMGREYTQLATPFVHGRRIACDDQQQNAVTLYSNHELAQKMLDVGIPVDEKSLAVLSPKGQDGTIDATKTILEAFHGTLRQVLNSWATRMGFTYYWDTDEAEFEIADQGAQPEDLKTGKLKFLDLTKPLTYEKIKTTVELAVGSCNLLEKSVTHSMEDTFSQAISAKYTKAGGYPYGQAAQFAFLDVLALPVHGCNTCKGKEWNPSVYSGDEGKRQQEEIWYREWDAANYYPKKQDKEIRRWSPVEFQRPKFNTCDCADGAINPRNNLTAAQKAKRDEKTEIFRDWIRLIKAASLGQAFFKSYIFMKKLASNPDMITPTLADLQTLSTLQGGGGADDRNVGITEIAAKLMQAGKIIVSRTPPPGGSAQTYNVGGQIFYELADAGQAKPGDFLGDATGYDGDVNGLVPVVPNKAVDLLITSADQNRAGKEYPNIKICNGVVVGKDCLSVNLLHPVWNDVQQLYLDTSNTAPCGKKKSRFKNSIEVDAIEEDGRVARIVAFRQPDQGAPSFVISSKIVADSDNDIRNDGSPYIFHKVNSYGNSFVLDSAEYDGLFQQLRSLAENAGRFYVSPELITRKEFSQRDYTNTVGSVRFQEKVIDVGDSDFDELFEVFDPMASIAKRSMPNALYNEFCFCCGVNDDECECPESDLFGRYSCELVDKDRLNKEKGIGQQVPPNLPADWPINPCAEDGDDFGSGNEKGQPKNTARPNLEQWIACLARKATFCADWKPKQENLIRAQTFETSTVLITPAINGNPAEYRLKYAYKSGVDQDFTGGKGYTNSENEGDGPELKFKVLNGGSVVVEPVYKLIIERGTIMEILFELPGTIEAGDNGEEPMVEIEFPDPPDDERNFFGSVKDDVAMSSMDSILKQNYDKRNDDKDDLCCCTNLDEGVVYFDTGSKLKTWLPEDVIKQVKRISEGINLPIQNTDMNTLVDVLARENQTITFSTNLIPINRLQAASGPVGPALDELDWIVDQVTIGDPFDTGDRMDMNPLNDGSTDQRLKCKYTKEILYKKEGDAFEMVGFAMPKKIDQQNANAVGGQGNAPAGNQNQEAGENYEVLVNEQIGEGDDPCELFKYNVKDYRVNFMNVGDEDIEGLGEQDCDGSLPLEGSPEWEEFIEKRVGVIKEGIADFLRKQSYLQDNRSFSTSLTIADNGLLDEDGKPVEFENGKKGLPSIEEGLESLSISVSSSGSQLVIGIGTKKKLRVLDPNFDQWEKLAPRIKRVLGLGTGLGNG